MGAAILAQNQPKTSQTESRACRSTHAGQRKSPVSRAFPGGRYWARTSDPQLVELVLSQLS
jgi:hypothetical protein